MIAVSAASSRTIAPLIALVRRKPAVAAREVHAADQGELVERQRRVDHGHFNIVERDGVPLRAVHAGRPLGGRVVAPHPPRGVDGSDAVGKVREPEEGAGDQDGGNRQDRHAGAP